MPESKETTPQISKEERVILATLRGIQNNLRAAKDEKSIQNQRQKFESLIRVTGQRVGAKDSGPLSPDLESAWMNVWSEIENFNFDAAAAEARAKLNQQQAPESPSLPGPVEGGALQNETPKIKKPEEQEENPAANLIRELKDLGADQREIDKALKAGGTNPKKQLKRLNRLKKRLTPQSDGDEPEQKTPEPQPGEPQKEELMSFIKDLAREGRLTSALLDKLLNRHLSDLRRSGGQFAPEEESKLQLEMLDAALKSLGADRESLPKDLDSLYGELDRLSDIRARTAFEKENRMSREKTAHQPGEVEQVLAANAETEIEEAVDQKTESGFRIGDYVYIYNDKGERDPQPHRIIADLGEERLVHLYQLDDGKAYFQTWLEKVPEQELENIKKPLELEIAYRPPMEELINNYNLLTGERRDAEAEIPEAGQRPEIPGPEPERYEILNEASQNFGEATQAEQEPQPEQLREVREAVSEEARDIFAEQLASLRDQDKELYEKIINNKNLWDRAADFATKTLKSEKLGGLHLEAVSSFLGGTAVRYALRNSFEIVTSANAALAGSVGAGAAVGGLMRGFREGRLAIKELYSAKTWEKEFEELSAKSGIELAELHGVLLQAINEKKVKGNKQEALSLVLKLRDVETLMGGQKDLSGTIDARQEAMKTTDLAGEREKIFKDLLKSKRWAVTKKAARGAVVGAAIGAVGGYLGGKLVEYLTDPPTEDIPYAESLKESFKSELEANSQISTALAADLGEKIAETKQQALEDLLETKFSYQAAAGQGYTHIAREAIHDYLTNELEIKSLDDPATIVDFGKEQLVYAEDYLKDKLGDKPLALGERVEVEANLIAEALEKSKALGEEQLANIQKEYVAKISEQEWAKVLDYSQVLGEGQNHAGEITGYIEALKAAQAGTQEQADRMADTLREIKAAPEQVPEQIEEQEKKFDVRWLDVIAAASAAAAGGLAAIRYREKLKGAAVKVRDAVKEKFSKIELPKIPIKEYIREKSRETEKAKAKFDTDPVKNIMERFGIRPKMGEIKYRVADWSNLEKEKLFPKGRKFNNYADYRAYLEQESPYLRGILVKKYESGIILPRKFQEQTKNLSGEQKKELDQEINQIQHGLAADQSSGKPGITPRTAENIWQAKQTFYEQHRAYFNDAWETDENGNYYAYERLQSVIKNTPPQPGVSFTPGRKSEVQEFGRIVFNPDDSDNELTAFFKEVMPKAAELAKLEEEFKKARIKLGGIYNINIYSHDVHGRQGLAFLQSLELALSQINAPQNLEIYLHKSRESTSFPNNLNLEPGMSSEEIKSEMNKYLSKRYGS